jgi:hypothetical protein
VEGFVLDKSISSNTSNVYIHPSGHVVTTHQGTTTALDWGNNAIFAATGDLGYKMTPRYREAPQVQQQAKKNMEQKI